ncbi:conserved hypothetical protein [Burkholderiales bacterium 8X]|nr:conserved hypothetical protein [Burkholderiales bacterium 8X]
MPSTHVERRDNISLRQPPSSRYVEEASVNSPLAATASQANAELCQRAVRAIWRSLDDHELLDEQVRAELALLLEPLTALPFDDRPRRLIDVLRLPNPIDGSNLYWLTRRLMTLVPELQAAAARYAAVG